MFGKRQMSLLNSDHRASQASIINNFTTGKPKPGECAVFLMFILVKHVVVGGGSKSTRSTPEPLAKLLKQCIVHNIHHLADTFIQICLLLREHLTSMVGLNVSHQDQVRPIRNHNWQCFKVMSQSWVTTFLPPQLFPWQWNACGLQANTIMWISTHI